MLKDTMFIYLFGHSVSERDKSARHMISVENSEIHCMKQYVIYKYLKFPSRQISLSGFESRQFLKGISSPNLHKEA